MEEKNELLRAAATEIQLLRSHNQIMSARLTMYDQMMALFNAEPPRHGVSTMGEDILWKINKALTKPATQL